jgi:hypothetical protein
MSTSTIFKFPSVIRRQHEGPLGIHIDMYEAMLGEHGYSPSLLCHKSCNIAVLSWVQPFGPCGSMNVSLIL